MRKKQQQSMRQEKLLKTIHLRKKKPQLKTTYLKRIMEKTSRKVSTIANRGVLLPDQVAAAVVAVKVVHPQAHHPALRKVKNAKSAIVKPLLILRRMKMMTRSTKGNAAAIEESDFNDAGLNKFCF